MSRKQKPTAKPVSSKRDPAPLPSSIPEIKFRERLPLLPVLRSAGALLLIMSIVGLLHPAWRLWGFHHLAFLPTAAAVVLLALSALFLSPFGKIVTEKASALLIKLADRSAWLWVLLALIVFFSMRIAVPLLGDSQLWIRELTWVGELDARGTRVKEGRIFMRKEPLSLAAHEGLFEVLRIMQPYDSSEVAGASQHVQQDHRLNYFRDLAKYTYVYMSMLAGALTILVLILFARRRIPAEGRAPFFLTMLSGGGLLLFFGYVENYSWTSFWMIVYMLAGVTEALTKPRFPWKTALLFVIALGFHYGAILLLPGLVFLMLHAFFDGKQHSTSDAPDKLLRKLVIVFVVAGVAGYLYVKGWKGWISVMPLLPQWSKDGYCFIALNHWIDLLSLFAFVAPVSIVAAIALKTDDQATPAERATVGFLKLCAGAGVIFAILFNPNLGMARDWDMLAMSLWPLVVYGAWKAAHVPSVNRMALISALGGFVLLVSVPTILVNHDYEASIDRFKTLLAIDEPRAAYGWENLALHYQRTGKIEKRVDAWWHAMEIERNPRYVFNFADAMKLAGRLEDAVPYYIEAAIMMKDADIKIYREQLLYISTALIVDRKFDKAREVLDTAVEIMPSNPHAKRLLLMLDDAELVDSLTTAHDYTGAKAAALAAQAKDPENSYWGRIIGRLDLLMK